MQFWFVCRPSNNVRLVVSNSFVVWFKLPPLVIFTLIEAFHLIFLPYVSLINNFHPITFPELCFMQYSGLLLIGCSRQYDKFSWFHIKHHNCKDQQEWFVTLWHFHWSFLKNGIFLFLEYWRWNPKIYLTSLSHIGFYL